MAEDAETAYALAARRQPLAVALLPARRASRRT